MRRREFLRLAGKATLAGAAAALPRSAAGAPPGTRPPNFVVVLTDDQGYQDVGCFGSPRIRTPRLDRMAAEGIRLTSFYAQAVCGPSRAALMTGCYPMRVAEPGNRKHPHTILHPDEVTLPEVLKARGYATACIGKWHLAGPGAGGRGRGPYPPELMPNAQGFDLFFGTPAHNGFTRQPDPRRFVTQLLRGSQVVESPADMNTLTKRYTEEAVKFIRRHKDEPFFLYLAHNMPHVPLGASAAFRGRSKRGLYGDVIEEIDWSVGQVLDTLKELGLDENTLVLFTSDNGPWIEKHIGDYAGCALPLRGSKMMTWDGGCRVPCIVRWPGKVAAGAVSGEIVTTMDLLPTFAGLAAAPLPKGRVLDGRDAWPILSGQPGARSAHEAFCFYCFTHLQAVRSGRWKLVRARPARPPWCSWSARMVDAVPQVQLYDLEADVGETRDVADQHPEVVARLTRLVEKAREDLGDYDLVGKGQRFLDESAPIPKAGERWHGRTRGRPPKVVYDHPEPVGDLRFDFETGDLQGWRVVDGSFEVLVNDRARFHHLGGGAKYNKQGRHFLSTLERKAGGKGKDAQTGIIESPVFALRGPRMSFLIGGGRHPDTYVALCDLATGAELLKARGANGEAMLRIHWDVGKFRGRKLFLRIVDRHTGGWGHVTFDDFSAEATLDPEATADRFGASPKP